MKKSILFIFGLMCIFSVRSKAQTRSVESSNVVRPKMKVSKDAIQKDVKLDIENDKPELHMTKEELKERTSYSMYKNPVRRRSIEDETLRTDSTFIIQELPMHNDSTRILHIKKNQD